MGDFREIKPVEVCAAVIIESSDVERLTAFREEVRSYAIERDVILKQHLDGVFFLRT